MIRKFISTVFLLGLAVLAKAQFASPEEKQLQKDAIALAKNGKKEEAMALVKTIKDYHSKISCLEAVIENLFEYGSRREAMKLANQHLDSIDSEVEYKKLAAFNYSNMAVPYARFLMKKGLAHETYPILRKVVDRGGVMHFSTPALYAETLVRTGRYDEAVQLIQSMIMRGSATSYIMDTLYREAFFKLKGKKAGFEVHKDSVIKAWKHAVKDSVAGKMVRQAAPDFVLKNAEGGEVKLSALRGKTVVLDFWANWCMPCKASFPAMKIAQDRFKGDTSVVFLFIHTMERSGNDPVPEAISYMKQHGFDFQVLFDLRDAGTKVSPVSKSFEVRGIPTKFIIDPEGNTRFISIGGTNLSHTDVMAAEYVIAMVELASGK